MTATNDEEAIYTRVLSTYNLQLIGPGPITGYERDEKTKEFFRYEGIAPSLLREIEENINDLLLTDYHVVIREWDDETNEPRRLT